TFGLTVRVTDAGSPALHDDGTVTITVRDVNEPPTAIALSATTVAENRPAGTVVGTLSATDPDRPAQSFTFSIVTVVAAPAPGTFTIVGNQLRTAKVLDHEAIGHYTITIRATDNGVPARSLTKVFTITVGDANDAPTEITLTPSSIVEGSPIGSTVGTLAAVDQDPGQTHTFAFATGAGSADNPSFTIAGGQLKTAVALNHSTKSSYSVRTATNDGPGGMFARAFTITVTDVNDPPSDIALSNASVAENQAAGAVVGTLTATDPDVPAQSFAFTLQA